MATDNLRANLLSSMSDEFAALWDQMWSERAMTPKDWSLAVDAPGLPAAGQAGPITMAPTTRKCALCGDTVPIDKPACQRAMDCVDLGQIIARKKLLKEM